MEPLEEYGGCGGCELCARLRPGCCVGLGPVNDGGPPLYGTGAFPNAGAVPGKVVDKDRRWVGSGRLASATMFESYLIFRIN